MRILLKGGKVLTLNADDRLLDGGDVLINGDTIEEVAIDVQSHAPIDRVLDCRNKLVMPGLINAHLHSDENFFRGLFDNLPLELWMLYSCPPLAYGPFSDRLIYLRTMLGAVEMVKSGITCVQDDVSECPGPTISGYSEVFKAYTDIGLRANVALNNSDREYCDKLPYAREIIPRGLQDRLAGTSAMEDLLHLYHEIIGMWNGKSGAKVVVSSSAPQRCTDKYMLDLYDLACSYDLPFHTHILETRLQAVTGPEFYGRSIVKHMGDLGLLTERLTIAHSIWVDDEDVELMGKGGVSVAHNPVSNLKLGSGIMPLRKLVAAGVNVALGTDGMSSNDGQSIFEAMKLAALLHRATGPDYHRWPDSDEALRMATRNAARSAGRAREIGSLEAGRKADIIILNLKSTAFTPLNNVKKHLVYCENGNSVETVLIGGKLVMHDRRLLTVDEQALLQEIADNVPDLKARFAKTAAENNRLFPYIDQLYWRCLQQRVGVNRFSGAEKDGAV